MRGRRQRRWLFPALASAAMLLLPTLFWILVPRPHGFALPPATTPAGTSEAPGPAPSTPEPAAPRPTRPPRPARTAGSDVPAAVGPVSGLVLDPDGHPVANAVVKCEERGMMVQSNEQGRFELGPDAAGCAAVADGEGHVASDRVTLSAGASNTLRLNRGGVLEGDVVDERGAPIAAYLLAVESYQGPAPEKAPGGQLKSVQDPRGAFSWDRLAPGRYVLTASADGRPPARSRPVDVETSRTTAHVRITLTRGAVLSGRIVDASTRKPLAGAVVTLDAYTGTRAQSIHPARSDDQGAYSMEGAPAGPFSIRVTRDGYRARVVPGLTSRGGPTIQQDVELNPIVDGGPTGDDFAGVGAFLGTTPRGVTFARLVPGGPAETAGLQAGDLIRRLDGADASAFSVNECMQSLRGPEGSRISVQVEREGRRVDVIVQRRAFTL